MEEKAFKTIDEQLVILKSRGLKVVDEQKAKDFLERCLFPKCHISEYCRYIQF